MTAKAWDAFSSCRAQQALPFTDCGDRSFPFDILEPWDGFHLEARGGLDFGGPLGFQAASGDSHRVHNIRAPDFWKLQMDESKLGVENSQFEASPSNFLNSI